jgi:Ca2+-binding EF-hand superfamily protein
MEGTITLEEYYDALEAYNCEGEEHFPIDMSNYYVNFGMKAVFKLVRIMKERNISHIQLFRTCDKSGDGIIDTKELGSVLGSLSPEFGIKDCYSLQNFFDIDKNGECDESEFIE